MSWTKIGAKIEQSKDGLALIPYLGQAACGLFGITEDYEEESLSLDQYMVINKEATYFIKAEGDSMKPIISPGDILVVDRSLSLKNNHIIACTLNNERLCKRFLKINNQTLLVSDNKHYRPIVLDEESDFILFGIVTGIVRSLR